MRNKRYRVLGGVLLITVLVAMSLVVLSIVEKKQENTLIATWKSQETGQVITFTDNGTLEFKSDLPSATYRIISPNRMEYTIQGMVFEMYYKLDENHLYWGMSENEYEIFDKK